ncbi:MAG: hypothetical protein IK095_02820 [Oscillospiraceae bacterium]|nr:hypothetical protein [Oscillospiraceae bacterium]
MAGYQIPDIGRLSHATIVVAPTMEESLHRAGELAAAAVCLSAGPLPCGQCRACRKAMAGIHPDVIRISRLTDSKGKQKKELLVDQIRALALDAVVLPNESARKVYILEDADSMNGAAQNAALKLLEEPPAGVYFLLCVTNPACLLDTVRSRCAVNSDLTGEAESDPEQVRQAEEFLRLVAAKDRAELFAWCSGQDDMDRAELDAFLEAASAQTAERILGRRGLDGLSPRDWMALRALLERCRDWSRVNTGIKLIMGLLAVDAIAWEEK